MAVIIFEGPDRCGKSTQIKRLMSHFTNKPCQWLHYSSVPNLSDKDQRDFLRRNFVNMFELIKNKEVNWFLDRSHLGELVYGPKYRPGLNHEYVLDLEVAAQVADRNDMYLILLFDSSLANVDRDDGDSYTSDKAEVWDEVVKFQCAVSRSYIPRKKFIDIANKDVEMVAQEIYNWIFVEKAPKSNSKIMRDLERARPKILGGGEITGDVIKEK